LLFVDDLQWASRTPLGFIDLVFSEEPIEGLLLVGAFRDGDVDMADPLEVPLSRWRGRTGVKHLCLDNLSVSGLASVVAEVLHIDPASAAGLAELIHPCTSGRPYETVELLEALRRDGLLTITAAGWRWDAAAVRAQLGGSELAGLLAGRVKTLPVSSRQLLGAMACLGGRAELNLLQTATATPVAAVEQALAPALEEGVLVAEPGGREAVRFRHDRIRDIVLAGLDPPRRRGLQLAMARRLGEVPEFFAVAAEQYLPVADAVEDPGERAVVVRLLRCAAAQARMTGEYPRVNALLATALRLVDPRETATLMEVHISRHAALFSIGHLDEADEEYGTIERLCPTALQRADPTAVQVRSLTNRNRFAEAVRLGVESLRALGIAVPAPDCLPAELDHQTDRLYRWLDHTDSAGDLARPDITDPTLLAASALIDATLPPAFFGQDFAMRGWLGLEALRILIDHGPAPALIGPAGHAAYYALVLRGDYAAGYRGRLRILALGEARGYEPGTSHARFGLALLSCWVEPIENGVLQAQRAREGLIAGGDLANAGYTFYPAVTGLLDAGPSLDACVAEVEAGLDFVRRTGSEQTGQMIDGYRWLAGALRGEGPAAAAEVAPDRYAGNPLALFNAHHCRALAAAIFGDQAGVSRHSAAVIPLLPAALGVYPSAVARLLRGLALAGEVRAGRDAAADARLSELDEVSRWLAARASDAPENFLHLVRLLEAERAWAVGDFRAAALGFDTALREAAGRPRPWHRALITERAARFSLGHGLDHSGYVLLAQARQHYLAWGATAKVDQLDWAYPTLRPHPDPTDGEPADSRGGRVGVSTGTLDLLAILSASQALSAQTSIDRLHARVVEVLGAMTGATEVHLLLCSEDLQGCVVSTLAGYSTPISGTGHELPMSVLRYVHRTAEPLVVADVTVDDRFARDPYFSSLEGCSLLVVPILSQGRPRVVLLLENRLLRGAFTTERLDAVMLIAGQLAVSLDNAQLYADLTASRARIVAAADHARRRIERDLHDGAQQRLVSLALRLRAAQAAPPDPGELAGRLGSLVSEVTSTLDELRELARGIHPVVLAEGGLAPALEVLARRSAIPVELDVAVERRLPEQVEIAAYYAVSEALTNVAKHAGASVVEVGVDIVERQGGDLLRVEVRDDGRGGAVAQGSGLVGLRDRVEALGGRISVSSPLGSGTTLGLELPLTGPNGGTRPS
jgi:signal transduction histidine kinase